jgi:hypothetical protein
MIDFVARRAWLNQWLQYTTNGAITQWFQIETIAAPDRRAS